MPDDVSPFEATGCHRVVVRRSIVGLQSTMVRFGSAHSHALGGGHLRYGFLGSYPASHGYAVLHPLYLDSGRLDGLLKALKKDRIR